VFSAGITTHVGHHGNANVQFFDGVMGELVFTNTELTGTDLTNLLGCFKAKWGTP
jgi:hypothetical protein